MEARVYGLWGIEKGLKFIENFKGVEALIVTKETINNYQ
jgi:hypothetical protein